METLRQYLDMRWWDATARMYVWNDCTLPRRGVKAMNDRKQRWPVRKTGKQVGEKVRRRDVEMDRVMLKWNKMTAWLPCQKNGTSEVIKRKGDGKGRGTAYEDKEETTKRQGKVATKEEDKVRPTVRRKTWKRKAGIVKGCRSTFEHVSDVGQLGRKTWLLVGPMAPCCSLKRFEGLHKGNVCNMVCHIAMCMAERQDWTGLWRINLDIGGFKVSDTRRLDQRLQIQLLTLTSRPLSSEVLSHVYALSKLYHMWPVQPQYIFPTVKIMSPVF